MYHRIALFPLVAISAFAVLPSLARPPMTVPASVHLATEVKTFKVVLSKSDKGSNREVYIQAKDSSDARDTAKDQNPGWTVEMVSEVKK